MIRQMQPILMYSYRIFRWLSTRVIFMCKKKNDLEYSGILGIRASFIQSVLHNMGKKL